jgi:hypothetical protein
MVRVYWSGQDMLSGYIQVTPLLPQPPKTCFDLNLTPPYMRKLQTQQSKMSSKFTLVQSCPHIPPTAPLCINESLASMQHIGIEVLNHGVIYFMASSY